MRHFPDRKGLITGIAVAGFGFGALVWVKLAGSWGHLIDTFGVLGTWRIYGFVFLAAIGTVPPGLEDMVKADVQEVMGKSSPVRVIILQSAAGAPLEAADPEDREPSISARPRA